MRKPSVNERNTEFGIKREFAGLVECSEWGGSGWDETRINVHTSVKGGEEGKDFGNVEVSAIVVSRGKFIEYSVEEELEGYRLTGG